MVEFDTSKARVVYLSWDDNIFYKTYLEAFLNHMYTHDMLLSKREENMFDSNWSDHSRNGQWSYTVVFIEPDHSVRS